LKRFLSCLFLFSILVLNTGCKKSSAVTAVTTGLSFNATISSHNSFIECDAVIDKNGSYEFTVTAPEKAKGLKITYKGNKVLSFNGLEYNIDGNYEKYGILDKLYEILLSAENNKNKVNKIDNSYILKGKTDEDDYEILLGESGIPIKITSGNIEIAIKNATITDN